MSDDQELHTQGHDSLLTDRARSPWRTCSRQTSRDQDAINHRSTPPGPLGRNIGRWSNTSVKLFLAFVFIFALQRVAWSYSWSGLYRGPLRVMSDSSTTVGVQSTKPTLLVRLSQDAIPGGQRDRNGERRLIIVGDIHGCVKQLERLLDRVNFNPDRDHLITAGDNIGKGPDSAGVVDRLISLRASSVRGNWEDRVLVAAQSTTALGHKNKKLLMTLKPHHFTFLSTLPIILQIPAIEPPNLPWPNRTSLSGAIKPGRSTISSGNLGQMLDDINVVHGGLVPNLPLVDQDPHSVMNMRALDAITHIPSENRHEGVPWYIPWNQHQECLASSLAKSPTAAAHMASYRSVLPSALSYGDKDALKCSKVLVHVLDHKQEASSPGNFLSRSGVVKSEDVTSHSQPDDMASRPARHRGRKVHKHAPPKPVYAVYGHDSKTGLNLQTYSRGLDSGCVAGGRLTALVIDAWGHQTIESVDCSDRAEEISGEVDGNGSVEAIG